MNTIPSFEEGALRAIHKRHATFEQRAAGEVKHLCNTSLTSPVAPMVKVA